MTGGVAAAIEAASTAAGDRRVHIMGGASIVRQALRTGVVDRLRLHIVPLLPGPAPLCSTVPAPNWNTWTRWTLRRPST
ncbi:dihydrofolate reductase family protein [Planobispora siamensis]|uniref:dihydrofolate reductase family protein n=1 Tax=Planobispora siamensis TaxID=936338 RepID=UPI0019516977|nr:dihydrofolate reductase family protein [Planobispora siamensis]